MAFLGELSGSLARLAAALATGPRTDVGTDAAEMPEATGGEEARRVADGLARSLDAVWGREVPAGRQERTRSDAHARK